MRGYLHWVSLWAQLWGIVFTELSEVETYPRVDGTVLQTGPSAG